MIFSRFAGFRFFIQMYCIYYLFLFFMMNIYSICWTDDMPKSRTCAATDSEGALRPAWRRLHRDAAGHPHHTHGILFHSSYTHHIQLHFYSIDYKVPIL